MRPLWLDWTVLLLAAAVAGPGRAGDSIRRSSLKPSTDSWPTYNGDYSGRRFSTLTKINAGERQGAEPRLDLRPAGRRHRSRRRRCMIGGVLYFTTPDHVYAIDARTGRELWHYTLPRRGGIHIGNRGVASLGDTVYFVTTDCNLVALDIKDGKRKWAKEFCARTMFYYGSVAPVVVKDKLITGASGDDLDVPGYLEAHDPATGELIWRWYVTAAERRATRARTPGRTSTWRSTAAA